MTIDEVEAYFKTGYYLRKKTGLSAGSISNWKKIGYIPLHTQIKIEALTNGDLKAGTDANQR